MKRHKYVIQICKYNLNMYVYLCIRIKLLEKKFEAMCNHFRTPVGWRVHRNEKCSLKGSLVPFKILCKAKLLQGILSLIARSFFRILAKQKTTRLDTLNHRLDTLNHKLTTENGSFCSRKMKITTIENDHKDR